MSVEAINEELKSSQCFQINTHRLDIILPNKQNISMPLVENMKGIDVISIIRKNKIKDFVITRTNPDKMGFYEVLYVNHKNHELLSDLIVKSDKGFKKSLLERVAFLPNRLISTPRQRMTLYVFTVETFLDMYEIYKASLKLKYCELVHKSENLIILVKLPSGLVIDINVGPNDSVKDVVLRIYKEMIRLYGRSETLSHKNYIFSTIDGYVPQFTNNIIFRKDQKLKEAINLQKLNKVDPYFCYRRANRKNSENKLFDEEIKALDLVKFSYNSETLSLNQSLLCVRKDVEKQRLDMLIKNPLMARMRISEVYPPLNIEKRNLETNNENSQIRNEPSSNDLLSCSENSFISADNEEMCLSRENQMSSEVFKDFCNEQSVKTGTAAAIAALKSRTTKGINLKVEIQSGGIDASSTSLSVRVPYDGTAIGAIKMILDKLEKISSLKGLNPDDYVLVIPGMDEVIAGETKFIHFVSVRQYILSGQPIMSLLLLEKKVIIDSIKNKEMVDIVEKECSLLETKKIKYKIDKEKNESDSMFKHVGIFPHNKSHEPLVIYIRGCLMNNIKTKSHKYFIKIALIHGLSILVEPQVTKLIPATSSIIFNQQIVIPLEIASIPRAARISFTLFKKKKKDDIAIATYNFPVFTFDGYLNHGRFVRKMWNNCGMNFILTTCESNEESPTQIMFSFPRFNSPIKFTEIEPKKFETKDFNIIPADEIEIIQKLKTIDPLTELSKKDKEILWKWRGAIYQYSILLPLVLISVDYTNPDQVNEIPSLLEAWEKPSATSSLTLIDAKFADPKVRKYAVERLNNFSDEEIRLYLLQLVQALKYELYDDSPLLHFLVRRGSLEPKFLGHQLFWQLVSEAHLSHIRLRFSKILVNFMCGLGRYRDELLKGYEFTKSLVKINIEMQQMDYTVATEHLRKRLQTIEIPEEFHLPMDPRLIVKKFIIEKCKVMNSKKKPFWLTFENASKYATGPVQTLFKVGDDLRQDQLTLQVMSVMEYLWRKDGIDLHMNCYGILPTGLNQGFIEVVPNSITEAELQQREGTFSDEIYFKYINENASKKSLPIYIENFRLSSAGYAVATCVLGIGDRHPGNIMIQRDGHFLHIDFGHFLGNFKTKLGYQRENAPFHFTPASINVINREPNGYALFENNCHQALNILRKNANLFITLFLLMLGTGIPELQKQEDIMYMKNMLMLDKTDEEADQEFNNKIKQSLTSTRTKVNNWIHNLSVS